MGSAGPVATRTAGQPTVFTGTDTRFATGFDTAEFKRAFGANRFGNPPHTGARHRDAGHPSDPGEVPTT